MGLSLERRSGDRSMNVYVERVVPHFAADISGEVFVDDIVEAVDNMDIRGLGLDQIKRLTIGPEKTPVKLDIRREGQGRFSVTLWRHVPDFVNDSNAEASDALVDRYIPQW